MKLIDASEFIRNYNSCRVEFHDQLRLNNTGDGNQSYLIKAGLGYGLGTLVMRGLVVVGSNGKIIGKEKVEFRISKGMWLGIEKYQFVTVASGIASKPMYFDVYNDGTWGSMEGGEFKENKLFHMRDVPEKRNDFDPENFGFSGGHCDVPDSVEIPIKGIGCMVVVPTGDTIKTLIDAYTLFQITRIS